MLIEASAPEVNPQGLYARQGSPIRDVDPSPIRPIASGVEIKSLKMYMRGFRNRVFLENVPIVFLTTWWR